MLASSVEHETMPSDESEGLRGQGVVGTAAAGTTAEATTAESDERRREAFRITRYATTGG